MNQDEHYFLVKKIKHLEQRIEKLREALGHYNQWRKDEMPTTYDFERDVDCGCCSNESTGAVAYQALKDDL